MQIKNFLLAAAAAAPAVAQNMSICDKYTVALLKENTAANQYTLLSLLVNTAAIGNYTGPTSSSGNPANNKLPGSMVAVPGILAPAGGLIPYFSGALKSTNRNGMPTSVNFLDGNGAKGIYANATSAGTPGSNMFTLVTHLYSYFGAALGCSTYGKMGFPAYMGAASQYSVHQYMNLNQTQVTYFIQQVGLAAKSFGASDADVTTVGNLLTTTFNYKCEPAATVIPEQGAQLQSICQANSCPTAKNASCSGVAASVPPMAVSMNGTTAGSANGTTGGSSGSGSSSPTTGGSASASGSSKPATATGAAAALYAPAMAAGLAGLAAIAL